MSNLILGEAKAAEMLGEAISKNPGYLKLRKLRASGTIAKTVRVFLFLVYINKVGSTCVYNPRNDFSTLELTHLPNTYAYRCIKILDNIGGHLHAWIGFVDGYLEMSKT